MENTGKGKGKSWSNLAQEYIYFEPKGKGKGKGKSYSEGHRYNGNTTGPSGVQTPSNVLGLTTSSIQFFTLMDLEFPGSTECTFKTVPYKTPTANRFMHEPIRTLPTKTWLKPRLDIPETLITDEHQRVYLHALECIRQVIQSPCERVIQDRDTGGWINCEVKFVLRMINTCIPCHIPYRMN